MEKLQAKYCENEQELNGFLATLHTDSRTSPQFHSIVAVPDMHGNGSSFWSLHTTTVVIVLYYVSNEN